MNAVSTCTSSNTEYDSISFLPQVSVVIPIYNGETDLPDLIKCLHDQTYPRNLVDYLLVDNKSTDRTAELIQDAAREAQSLGLRILFLSEHNIQGPSAARNTGIRASNGAIVAFTDVDCRPKPNWLLALVQPFANPDIGVVGGAIFALPPQSLLEKYAARRNTLSHLGPYSQEPPFGMTANLAIRKNAFSRVGLFRHILCEDTDICWRIQQIGNYNFQPATEAVILHRHRNSFRALFKQWRGYGRGFQCLYELYGVDLLPRVNWKKYYRRLGNWIFKEFPKTTVKLLVGKATFLDLVETPITLLTWNARDLGQKEVVLTEQMRQIEWE